MSAGNGAFDKTGTSTLKTPVRCSLGTPAANFSFQIETGQGFQARQNRRFLAARPVQQEHLQKPVLGEVTPAC